MDAEGNISPDTDEGKKLDTRLKKEREKIGLNHGAMIELFEKYTNTKVRGNEKIDPNNPVHPKELV